MIRRFALALSSCVLLASCASSGDPSTPPVPVFFDAADVPCAYTAVGPVSAEALRERNIESLTRRVLGRAGAEQGADAVLVERNERQTVERIDFNDPPESSARIILEGDLLRYTDASCGVTPVRVRPGPGAS